MPEQEQLNMLAYSNGQSRLIASSIKKNQPIQRKQELQIIYQSQWYLSKDEFVHYCIISLLLAFCFVML